MVYSFPPDAWFPIRVVDDDGEVAEYATYAAFTSDDDNIRNLFEAGFAMFTKSSERVYVAKRRILHFPRVLRLVDLFLNDYDIEYTTTPPLAGQSPRRGDR